MRSYKRISSTECNPLAVATLLLATARLRIAPKINKIVARTNGNNFTSVSPEREDIAFNF